MIDFFIAHFNDILPFILIGFGAQIIDGALGMAYGVISSTLLLALGVPPSRASASVHAAETFTTGVSAISHILHRNVDWKLFARLIIPGVVGGVTGAYVLTHIDGSFIKDIEHDPIDLAMVQAINAIGHVMGLKTIAEYVASEGILRRVEEIGIDYAQGYFLGEPRPLATEGAVRMMPR